MHTTNLLLVAMMLAAAATFATARNAAAADDTSSLEGKAAPDFKLGMLDGQQVQLSVLKGHVVVVDFWATWCPPCRKSLPHIQELSANKDLADKGLVVLAVNARETKDKAAKFLKDNNFTFMVPLDSSGATMKDYLVTGIPTTVIVGKDGKIKKVFIGFGGDETAKAIDEAVAAAIKG